MCIICNECFIVITFIKFWGQGCSMVIYMVLFFVRQCFGKTKMMSSKKVNKSHT